MAAAFHGPSFAGHAGSHADAEGACGPGSGGLPHQRSLQLLQESVQTLGKQLTIKTPPQLLQQHAARDSDAGGAQSGHSDVTHLMPASATTAGAAAAAASGHLLALQPGSPDSVVTAPKPAAAANDSPASAPVADTAAEVPHIAPLPPPDTSEGPEAAAEYEVYLQRWDAGDTLAQRWHRLAQSGRLAEVRADWEDWQLDVMLQQVKERTQAAEAQQPRTGAVTPGGTRPRRRRGDLDIDAADLVLDEPRRVRSRRVPNALQDYHVDSGRTPDRQDPAGQLLLLGGAADGSDDSTDEGAPDRGTAMQQQQGKPGTPRSPAAAQQQASKRPGSRLQHPMPPQPPQQLQQQLPPAARVQQQFARVAAQPFSPQQQQQLQAQQQQHQLQQQMLMMQQVMMQLQPGNGQQVSPEMTQMWFKIGTALGSMMQEKGGPAHLLTNPAAMTALIESVLKQTTGDPDAAIQQLAATLTARPASGGGAAGVR